MPESLPEDDTLPSLFIWQTYLLILVCGLLAGLWMLPACVSAFVIFLADKRLWRPGALLLGAAIFTASACAASHEIAQWRQIRDTPPAWLHSLRSNSRICGHVVRTAGQIGGNLRITLSDVRPEADTQARPLPGLCQWTWISPVGPRPLPGQDICIAARPARLRDYANEDFSALEAAWLAQDQHWRFYSQGDKGLPEARGQANPDARMREGMRLAFVHMLGLDQPGLEQTAAQQARAILPALLFGDRQYLARETQDLFAAGSIAHSLALSGQHLCVAGLPGLFLATLLRWAFPGIQLHIPRLHLVLALSLPFAAAYLWLGNAPPSLMRAFAMLCFLSCWMLARKAFAGLDVLGAALAILLILSPLSVYDTGLQMSALCVAVIILSAPLQARILRKININHKLLRKAFYGFAVILLTSLLIQLALLPLTVSRFGMAGLWFAINPVWLPLLGAITLPFAALALLLCQLPLEYATTAARLLADLSALPAQGILCLLEFLEHTGALSEPAYMRPYWSVFPAFALLFVFLVSGESARPQRLALPMAGLLLLALAPAQRLWASLDTGVSVEALDVGQGESILLSFPGGRALIDGGGSAYGSTDYGRRILQPYLAANRPTSVNAIFNTHPDVDHFGGLVHILRSFNTLCLFHNGHEAEGNARAAWQAARENVRNHTLYAGDVIYLGAPEADLRLEVLHPPAPAENPDAPLWQGNGASLIMRLCQGDRPLALFCGDADKKALRNVIGLKKPLHAPLVFAPHHGSDRNFLRSFYHSARPEIVVASCGYGNRWGFPGPKLQKFLNSQMIPFFHTDANGRIRVEFAKDGTLQVSPVMLPPVTTPKIAQ